MDFPSSADMASSLLQHNSTPFTHDFRTGHCTLPNGALYLTEQGIITYRTGHYILPNGVLYLTEQDIVCYRFFSDSDLFDLLVLSCLGGLKLGNHVFRDGLARATVLRRPSDLLILKCNYLRLIEKAS